MQNEAVVELVGIPLARKVPEMGFGEAFPHIGKREVKLHRRVSNSPEITGLISACSLCIYCALRVRYKPLPDLPEEEFFVERIFVGEDLVDGEARLIPEWAYADPQPTPEGQEQVKLVPAKTD